MHKNGDLKVSGNFDWLNRALNSPGMTMEVLKKKKSPDRKGRRIRKLGECVCISFPFLNPHGSTFLLFPSRWPRELGEAQIGTAYVRASEPSHKIFYRSRSSHLFRVSRTNLLTKRVQCALIGGCRPTTCHYHFYRSSEFSCYNRENLVEFWTNFLEHSRSDMRNNKSNDKTPPPPLPSLPTMHKK